MHHLVGCLSVWDVYCPYASFGFQRASLVSLLSCDMSMILIEWICSGQVELFWLWGATKLDNDDTLCSFSMKSRLVATE